MWHDLKARFRAVSWGHIALSSSRGCDLQPSKREHLEARCSTAADLVRDYDDGGAIRVDQLLKDDLPASHAISNRRILAEGNEVKVCRIS
eukprot:CAMPEP_0115830276 /NCGR_PEP_ID=MMETSP0287-20121206/1535_1 /TAXON_ID=412157 /ORGANISM="Chrysochromulina rotalis, Strain UIO044" /LENGTH=89 /DNA_ID=CAMNT_0003283577 /DNA_START=543 /DNA_END=813 /DNA_ORIENTATION=+